MKDELIEQAYVIFVKLVKNNRYFPEMVGKMGKWGTKPINGNESLLNMTFFHFIFAIFRLGSLLASLVNHTISKAFVIDFESTIPTP